VRSYQQILVLIVTSLSFSLSFSQSFQHRTFKYDWNDAIRITLDQSPEFKDYEAVVLYEEVTLDVMFRNIKRYQVFQFNTEEAISKHNLFRVPIVMDPPLSRIDNIYRLDSASFPMLLYEKINFFDARIIRNGEFVKAVLDEVAFRNEERTGDALLPYYVHYFYVRNLEPGDQLEVIISHEWPLFTTKYYLNGDLPKQEVTVILNNSPLGEVDLYVNERLGKFLSNQVSKDHSSYRISFENMLPVNSKLGTSIADLPRVEFFENKKYKTNERLFATDEVDTITWKKFLFGYVTRIDPGELRTWENYDLQSYKTTQFFEKMKTNSGNLSGTSLMDYINRYAVDKLDYKNDFNYFIHEEHGFHEMGKYLEQNVLREACRHEFYFNMLDRVNQSWYKIMLQDMRIHLIDTSMVNILYGDGLSYVMYDNDSVAHLFLPKVGRSGYYTNELPFYYTNQYAHLIPQTIPRKFYDTEPDNIKFPLLFIPETPYGVNHKKNISHINISLANKTSHIDSKINLSGQYSTLTRGYYLYGDKDTTISPTYYADIFKGASEVICKLDTSEKTFPYKHQFSIKSDPIKNILSTVDEGYVIDLSNLINIHYEIFDSKLSLAGFKHDFRGREEYIIELDFDQLVNIENMESYNKEITGEGYYFASNLLKIADNEYGLKIIWDVKDNYVQPENIPQLEIAFRTIKKFCQLKLKVKVQ
jgi:hypothetical protein